MTKNLILFSWVFLFSAFSIQAHPLTFPDYQVVVESEKSEAATLLLNRHQNLLVTLKPLGQGALDILDFQFDARMPQHKHGMVTKAKIEKIGNLKYRVLGVRFHMPGDWVLEFLIRDKRGQTRIEVPWAISAQ